MLGPQNQPADHMPWLQWRGPVPEPVVAPCGGEVAIDGHDFGSSTTGRKQTFSAVFRGPDNGEPVLLRAENIDRRKATQNEICSVATTKTLREWAAVSHVHIYIYIYTQVKITMCMRQCHKTVSHIYIYIRQSHLSLSLYIYIYTLVKITNIYIYIL